MKTTLEAFKQQILADKKRSAILSILMVVLVVVVVRALSPGSASVPETAVAVQPAPVVRPAAAPTMQPVLETIRPVTKSAAAEPTAPAQATRHRTVRTDDLPRSLKRDLFMTDEWTNYPLEASLIEKAKPTAQLDFWSGMAEAARQYSRQRHEESQTLTKELSDLELQSTLTGRAPLAYISGHLVRPGDRYAGFSIVRIEERRVLVEKYGQIHELVMR
jgi:hypothetical protein